MDSRSGLVFDLQRWSLHDGPGIRTNVFLKGCPLSCTWCSNPESQRFEKELVFFKDKCIRCGRCIKNCPYGAIETEAGNNQVNYGICSTNCYRNIEDGKKPFACTSQCYAEALDIMGKEKSADAVMAEVLSDQELYRKSGGGITITGGEPFGQPEFLIELLKRSKAENIHTAVETCAYTSRENIKRALPYIDFIFIDFKLFDPVKHQQYVGAGQELILENIKAVNEYSKTNPLEIVIRTPVIPGINDSEEEVGGICSFINQYLTQVSVYELLPYHRLGRGKYENIGKIYEHADLCPPAKEQMEKLKEVVADHGLKTAY